MIKKEKDINIEQNKFVMETNYFGTVNCVKAVEDYFKKNKKVTFLLFLQSQVIEDCQILVVMGPQSSFNKFYREHLF